jgi:hypothetical protein
VNRNEWADELIATMGWASGVRDGIVAQAMREGSNASNNPLDTTQDWPGATDFNSAGVKNYLTTDDGLAATKATLVNGHYNGAVAAGVVGDAVSYVAAMAASPWGTWSNNTRAQSDLAEVQANPTVGLVEVAGTTGPAPSPPSPPSPLGEPPMVYIRNPDNGAEYALTFSDAHNNLVLVHLDPQQAAIMQVAYGAPHEVNTGGLSGLTIVNP